MALQARGEVESASRASPRCSSTSWPRPPRSTPAPGPNTVSIDAEERRKRWVDKRLIEYGRMRARTLGWPDVYTFTKAMGERAVEELAHERGLSLSASCGRSIIESALEHPSPGWIDGFKMADPIIRAYGMGQIPEFPGIPEGIVDLIPVDYVVNAILAVAATPPPAGEPAHYNVSSGDRNPLRFFELYEYVREYFEAHPLPERGRGEHKRADLGLPRQPEGREDAAPRGDSSPTSRSRWSRTCRSPRRCATRSRRVDRDKARVDFVERYSDLYGMYTETEVVYTDDARARVVGVA